MRTLLLLLGLTLLGVARPAVAEESARAFVELDATQQTLWEQERVVVTIRIGVDRDFFRDHAVSLFRRTTDVLVQVKAPWLDDTERTLPDDDRNPSFVLGGRIVHADRAFPRERDGRTFTVLEVDRTLTADAPGAAVLSGASLGYAWTTRFEEDFLGERVPEDRHVETVDAAPLSLQVKPLPEAERPASFVDAVGRFQMAARLLPPGEDGEARYRLEVAITGEGNLDLLQPPPRRALEGFHVYDVVETREKDRLLAVYAATPLADDVAAFPPIALGYFDPATGTYGVTTTPAVPLPDRTAPTGQTSAPKEERSGVLVLVVALVALTLVVLVAWSARRGASRPEAEARPDPEAELDRALDGPDGDSARAFAAYLAHHLGCPPAAVVSPDLPTRLVRAGLDVELASEAAEAMERLIAARYGGEDSSPSASTLRALAARVRTASSSTRHASQ